jgi:voltage-gated potassium channel
VTPPFVGLDRRARRRMVLRAGLRIVTTTVLLFAIYALAPTPELSDAGTVAGLLAGLLSFAVLLTWQVRAIIGSDFPGLRAAEALAVAVPVLVIVFAYTYLSMSHANSDAFTEHLNHVDAVYFTVTTLGTVGFGDIAPATTAARVLVTAQIGLDIVLVAGLARLVVAAVQYGRQRQDAAGSGGSEDT